MPLALLALGALAAWGAWEALSYYYGRQAEQFDLTQLERMEAASVILDRHGQEMGKIFIQNRTPIAYDQISPRMIQAVIAAEDNRFEKHQGVDWMGIIRAAIANYRAGRISQGASTITQQLARNSFDLRERTYQRKLLEIFLARRIEKQFSKKDIMRLYLNRVYFGSGFYGVEAAARGYFGKPAAELDAGQAAMLAGLLKSPQALSPWNNREAARAARDFVLKRMRELRFLTRAEYREAVEAPLLVMRRSNPFKVSYAIDLIRQQAIAALGFDRAMNGGFRIHSTLDAKLQRAAEKAVREVTASIEQTPGYAHETFAQYRERVRHLEEKLNRGILDVKMPEPRYLQAAVIALESSTGAVLAMVGGREFKHSEYNRAVQARRPAGTVFTPFVFAAAFQQGFFPGDIVDDACIDNRFVMVGGDRGILGEWGVERPDNEYEGPIPMRDALARGKNAATVRAGFQVGLEAVKQTAAACGIQSPLRDFANTFLGSSENTLEELTLAFTPFGQGGMRPRATYLIHRIEDPSGATIYSAQPERVQALDPAAAWQVHSCLEDALEKGTAGKARAFGLGDFPAAGKPGTAYGFTDTYFIGYTSSVACGIWVGFDKPTRIFRGAFGTDLALPIWVQVMNAAASEFPALKIPRPENLREVEICRVSGLLATPQCTQTIYDPTIGRNVEKSTTYIEYATEEQVPNIPCDVHGPGIRSYAKNYDEGEWPRAAPAVDLSRIRPIAVNSPPLIGLNDVYGSVRPGGARAEEAIPVARAIAVNEPPVPPAPYQPPLDTTSPAVTEPPPLDAAVPRALPAGPLDAGEAVVPLAAPTPEPIRF